MGSAMTSTSARRTSPPRENSTSGTYSARSVNSEAATIVAVLVVEVALVGYKDRVQVALGAQDLLRAESAVLVGARRGG